MSKTWARLLSLILSLAFLLVQAPKPCLGDGRGAACTVTRCVCVALCTCQDAHREARLFTRLKQTCGAKTVHGDAASCLSKDALACHASDTWPHFQGGSRQVWLVAGVIPLEMSGVHARLPNTLYHDSFSDHMLCPPLPPPKHHA